jgi:hypothetical protein
VRSTRTEGTGVGEPIDARAFGPEACPEYFRAGAEWWGTFLFTFQPTGAPRIVAMTASATD